MVPHSDETNDKNISRVEPCFRLRGSTRKKGAMSRIHRRIPYVAGPCFSKKWLILRKNGA